ncbi:MAG TPA: hypothetical protein VLG37_01695 [Candidatus Saccharimonadales bacterium]|nr:hypothetical protein [Candidatus Saccharimonadales bacterium]
MSLTTNDLLKIRSLVEDVSQDTFESTGRRIVREEMQQYFRAEGRELVKEELQALENDIKDIYEMLTSLQSSVFTDKTFKKRSLEEKLLTLNAELLAAAKQAGITLPRN